MSNEFRDRMKKLDETVKPLDDMCSKILAYLSVKYPEEIGFNQILRDLRNYEKKIRKLSRTTLSTHLEHLLNEQLIRVRELTDSPLKFKPRKYILSRYFAELARDTYEYKLLNPADILPDMMRENTKALTIFLIDLLVGNMFEFVKNAVKLPEKIAAYGRHILYYHFDNLARAYRMVILEKSEDEIALKAIDEFDKYWKEMRNEKWGDLIATMHAYRKQGI